MMNKLTKSFLAVALMIVGAPSMAIEEPEFEIIRTTEHYEIRQYAPYIVAEVDVAGDNGDAGSRAFRILANYIFGNNQGGTKMAMTAPVRCEPMRVRSARKEPPAMTNNAAIRAKLLSALIRVIALPMPACRCAV